MSNWQPPTFGQPGSPFTPANPSGAGAGTAPYITGVSTSTPTVIQTPQSLFDLQAAEANLALEQQQYAWGQAQFAKNTALTDQLVATANAYNSPQRQQYMMGQAAAGASQAMEAQRTAAIQDLQGYGIDPSSGRYAALDAVERTQGAAAEAGAANQAELSTQATGLSLQTAALNAQLANTQTGANAMGSAALFGNLAKAQLPPVANTSTSTSYGFAPTSPLNANSTMAGSTRGSSAGANTGGGGTATPADNSFPGLTQPNQGSGLGAGGNAPNGAAGNQTVSPNDPFATGTGAIPYTQGDTGGINYGGANPNIPGIGNAGDTSGQGAINYSDPFSMSQYTVPGGTLAGGPGGQDPTQTGITDTSGYSYDNSSGFASGGAVPDTAIPDATTGGQVPQQASPSAGLQTDDVPANLNAGEFVIPRDVAAWKGHEFFQKLIDQSRKARTGASAKPTPGRQQQRPPTFASHAMAA